MADEATSKSATAPAPLPLATVKAPVSAGQPPTPTGIDLPVVTSKPRQKVPLGAGLSHTSWMRLVQSGEPLSKHAPGPGKPPRKITLAEVRQHASRTDAWMAVRGFVYDVTLYCEFHPGGVEEIMRGVGDDATDLFEEFHPWVSVESMLRPCLIGRLVPDLAGGPDAAAAYAAQRALGSGQGFSSLPATPAGAAVASAYGPAGTASAAMRVGGLAAGSGTTLKLLTPATVGKWHRVKVLFRKDISDDGCCVLIRCELATRQQRLGLDSAGKHVRVRVPDAGAASGEGKPFREYTPVSSLSASGFFDLAVKLVPEGAVSPALCKVSEGDVLEISGPRGELKYTHGIATWGGRARQASCLCLAGAGSGVTPILQLAQAVATDAEDKTPVHIIVSHRTEQAAMLNRELSALAMQHANVHLHIVTTSASDSPASQEEAASSALSHSRISRASGARITTATLSEHWPKPDAKAVCMWCGPPAFNVFMDDAVRELYYVAENCFQF